MSMNKKQVNLGAILSLITAGCFIFYILLSDKIHPCSIYSVWTYTSHWAKHSSLVAVAFLPIYVGCMIFGTAICSICFGAAVQRRITRRFFTKKHSVYTLFYYKTQPRRRLFVSK